MSAAARLLVFASTQGALRRSTVSSLRSAAQTTATRHGGALNPLHPRLNSSNRMMSTLILSEPIDSTSITPAATCSAVTAAHALQEAKELITLLVVGSTVPSLIPSGVSKIVHYESSSNDELTSEAVALAVAEAVHDDPDITHVLGASTKFGASVVPRAAAMLQVSPITDVVQILASGTWSPLCRRAGSSGAGV
jgi:electron transfer flavoprotein alpha subunit